MKLIIDIPNYNLDEVQNGSIASNVILKAIKNGKPYDKDEVYKEGYLKGYQDGTVFD